MLKAEDVQQLKDLIILFGGILAALMSVFGSVIGAYQIANYRNRVAMDKERKAQAAVDSETMPQRIGEKVGQTLSDTLGPIVGAWQRDRDEMRHLRDAHARLTTDFRTLKADFDLTTTRYAAESTERDTKIAALQRDLISKNTELDNANKTIQDLGGELQIARTEIGKLREEVKTLTAKVNEMDAERRTVISERDRVITERDAALAESAILRNALKASEANQEKLQQQISGQTEQIRILNAKLVAQAALPAPSLDTSVPPTTDVPPAPEGVTT